MCEKIYTRDEAAAIVELFENVLIANGIVVPSPEDDDKEDDNEAALYGSTYSDLLDEVEYMLVELLKKSKNREIVQDVFSGNF